MLSSSLTIYHSRGPKSMGVEGAERGEGGGEKRLFTQIAALRVCNQRARGERKKKSAKRLWQYFSVHLIARAP